MAEAECRRDTLPERWWRDPEHLQHELKVHGTYSATARAHGIKPYLLAKAWSDHSLPPRADGRPAKRPTGPGQSRHAGAQPFKPGVTIRGDWALFVTEPTPYQLGDIDGLLRDRGLDPEEWLVERVTVNEWDAYAGRDDADNEPRVVKLRQLKAHLKRKVRVDWLFPAVDVEKRHRPKKSNRRAADTLAVVLGDQQAPYHDEDLHRAFLRWLADVQPQLGALTGDTIDLPTISRHADRPHWNAAPQECINAGFRLLSDYVDASPSTSWRKLRGNHDWRLESELLTRAERMFGLTPADIPGEEQIPGYSIRRFLHLDRLGVELVGREGDKWELAEIELAPGVVVRHRPPNEKKLTRLHRTVIAGDTHRQSIKRVTVWHGATPHIITLVETGCMCRTDGLGFADHPDWQPGFATVALGRDGSVGFDLAAWDDGVLTWRGERWKP